MLYRVLETVGHWSMLDVFVVTLLTAVVQLGRFASVEPGPAVIPFAGVVVLTMLASAAYDPRAIWDRGSA
jgi:paraquat-inducible protein A